MAQSTKKELLRIVTPSNGATQYKYMELFKITGFEKSDKTLSGTLDLFRFQETCTALGIRTIQEFVDAFAWAPDKKTIPVYVNDGKDFDDINLLAYKAKFKSESGFDYKAPVMSADKAREVFTAIGPDDLPF